MNAPKGLTSKILIGMGAGVVLGIILNLLGAGRAEGAMGLLIDTFDVGGQIFVKGLKLLVVPLVFVSLVCGTAALDDIKKLGRVGGTTVLLYLGTTAVAISLALLFAIVIQPGAGFDLDSQTAATFSAKDAPPLKETFLAIFPTNPVNALAEGNMLQIIVFSILFGLAMTMAGESGKRVSEVFNHLNEVMMRLVMILMWLAPAGVFCLVTKVFAQQGFDAIAPLAKYFFVVLAVLLVQALVVYPSILALLSRLNPKIFLSKMKEVWAFAFSTSSSNATIPITLETAENKLGVKNSIASFTVPLGATINMDGTAIMQGVATGFIAQAYGIDIGLQGYLMVILTATLASIGTAGVPGVGLITLAMVLNQVGLPVEGIALIIGVDRLLDMVRTAVNVTGDSTVTCIVAKREKQLDPEIFNDRSRT